MIELRKIEAVADIETSEGKNYHLACSTVKSIQYSKIKNELEQNGLALEILTANKPLSRKQLRAICNLMQVNIEDVRGEE